jgi:hypothetical protein
MKTGKGDAAEKGGGRQIEMIKRQMCELIPCPGPAFGSSAITVSGRIRRRLALDSYRSCSGVQSCCGCIQIPQIVANSRCKAGSFRHHWRWRAGSAEQLVVLGSGSVAI